jgi:hypothetical protein
MPGQTPQGADELMATFLHALTFGATAAGPLILAALGFRLISYFVTVTHRNRVPPPPRATADG